jgi:hypothetical protein
MRATARRAAWLVAAVLVVALCACGGGGGGGEPLEATPSVPANVRAAGALRSVTVSWDATTERLAGFHVYRSADGSTFSKRTAQPVAGPSFADALGSPADDGILYAYRVTAVGAVESAPSATARAMHGTRLGGTRAAGVTTLVAESPYVVDGTLTLEAGNLTIDTGTAVYVLDGAVIDVAAGAYDDSANGRFVVKGLLRVLASAADHATFTSHKAGGLATGEGFALVFDHAPDYVPADGSGTLVQNTEVINLRGRFDPLQIFATAPAFLDTKLVARPESIATYFVVATGARFDHCLIEGLYPIIAGDLTGTTFAIQHSVLRAASAWNYSLEFFHASVPVADGQIAWNDIDGSQTLDIDYLEAGSIPLGNNYWRNGQPAVRLQFTGASVGATFTPALSEPPAGVGPSW